MERLQEALRQRLERKQEQLEQLPENAPGQMQGLQEYEFENDEAREKYEQLIEQLRQAMLDTFFKDMSQMLQNMSPDDMDRMRQMMQDLNQMLERQRRGEDPQFDEFMDQYGDMFGDNPPQSLEELIEQMQQQASQMQNLMDSMPSEMRQQLQGLMDQRMGEMGMGQELAQLAQNLEALYPMRDLRNQYPFRGQEELDLQAAMNLMGRHAAARIRLERALERVQYGGDIDDIDADELERLLGEEGREILEAAEAVDGSAGRRRLRAQERQRLGADPARDAADRRKGAGGDLRQPAESVVRETQRSRNRGATATVPTIPKRMNSATPSTCT